MRNLLQATPDATLDELVEELGRRGIKASRSGLDRYLGHIGLSFKKTLHVAEQDRPDVKAAREVWRVKSQPKMTPLDKGVSN